jgi:hypothetical protein
MAEKTGINRQYKDRLFKFVFGNPDHKEWTLALYNAINGSSYTNPDDIELNTIEDIVYMGMKNDVSFLITETINFYEQQSTFSPNIPLRIFLYAGKAYGKFIESSEINVYSSTLQKIPTPRCVCFYNGNDRKQDKVILKLSDAFVDSTDPQIEVTVTMLNVNYGHNKELMEVCKPLKEYSWFVEKIRQNHKMKMEIGMAVDAALDQMPEDFAIRQFLLDNRAEVKDVFLTEYNEQKTMAAFRDEYIAEGLEKGLVKGRVEGEENKANSIALTLLKRGKDTIEDIALITGLSVDTVKALATQNHVLDA